jgi:hypothetical protein
MNKMDGLKQLQLAAGEERGFMLLSSVLLSNLHKEWLRLIISFHPQI